MPAGPTLVQQMWEMMDNETKKVMVRSGVEMQDFEAKCRARMLAEVLALFMVPHFHGADQIAREALRRYRAEKAGDKEYETPGVGTQRYVPPPGTRRTPEPKKKAAPKIKSRFDESDTELLRNLAAKGQPIAKLAALMNATEDEVRAVL